MNERILEIAEQALEYANSHCDLTSLYWSDIYNTKFAELVIRDCIDILDTYRVRVTFEDGIEYNCVHPINAITKHFGI